MMQNSPALPAHLARYRDTGAWADRTIGDCARELAAAWPGAVAFPGSPAAPTYATLLAEAEALALALAELGLRQGDVISFQLPNWTEAAVINLAATLGGLIINPIVPIYRDAEVRKMLADCGAKAFFFAESFRGYDFAAMVERILPDLPELSHCIAVRGAATPLRYEALVEAGLKRPFAAPRVDPDAIKLLLYTSGTTGTPKAVLHSHNTLGRVSAQSFAHWGVSHGDTVLMPSPVTHISGYSNGLEQVFLSGTRCVLMESWDAVEAVSLIERHAVVGTVAATPFLKELADVAIALGKRLPSFRLFACGGAAVPADLIRDANSAFANPCATRVYGSSETPLVAMGFAASAHPDLAATTDGQVIDYDVRIVDDAEQDVPDGQEGEILARGPAMFMGYRDAGQTAEAVTADGYFRTGDLGLLTAEGAILITGRKKDLIIRGGENISAKEIEDVLARHPQVRESAVVSMPHPRLGEGICAFVIARGPTPPDMAELAAFVFASGLAKQKCPERIAYVADLPRTASGKVRKDVLRAEIRSLIKRESSGAE